MIRSHITKKHYIKFHEYKEVYCLAHLVFELEPLNDDGSSYRVHFSNGAALQKYPVLMDLSLEIYKDSDGYWGVNAPDYDLPLVFPSEIFDSCAEALYTLYSDFDFNKSFYEFVERQIKAGKLALAA